MRPRSSAKWCACSAMPRAARCSDERPRTLCWRSGAQRTGRWTRLMNCWRCTFDPQESQSLVLRLEESLALRLEDGSAVVPRQSDPRHTAGHAQTQKADRIRGIHLAFNLHPARRRPQALLVVPAEHDDAVVRYDVGDRDVMAVGMGDFRLAFEHQRRALAADTEKIAFALIVQLGDERGAFPGLHAGHDLW